MNATRNLTKYFLLAALYFGFTAGAQNLNSAQIKQIEDVAKNIAEQSNSNKKAMLDEMTVSFNAIAAGRNVRFESVLRVKKGLSSNAIEEWLNVTRAEIIPMTCAQNAKNLAFDRGLSYTFVYKNNYNEILGDIFVDKIICKNNGM